MAPKLWTFFSYISCSLRHNSIRNIFINNITTTSSIDMDYNVFLTLKISLGDASYYVLLFYYKLTCHEKWRNENEIIFFQYLPLTKKKELFDHYDSRIQSKMRTYDMIRVYAV